MNSVQVDLTKQYDSHNARQGQVKSSKAKFPLWAKESFVPAAESLLTWLFSSCYTFEEQRAD